MNHVVVGLISKHDSDGQKQYLLVKSKKDFGKYTGFWYTPGGHLEAGEDKKDALIREIKEELDLDINPIKKIAETESDIKDQITHWWSAELLSDKMKINEEEIAEAGWFSLDDMKTMSLWPATKKFFEKYAIQ